MKIVKYIILPFAFITMILSAAFAVSYSYLVGIWIDTLRVGSTIRVDGRIAKIVSIDDGQYTIIYKEATSMMYDVIVKTQIHLI